MQRVLSVLLLWFAAAHAFAASAVAPADVTLEGRWSVNVAQSDDGEALLGKRMEEIRKEQQRLEERHRRRMQDDPFAWEPEFTPPENTPQFRLRMEERDRAIRFRIARAIRNGAGRSAFAWRRDFRRCRNR